MLSNLDRTVGGDNTVEKKPRLVHALYLSQQKVNVNSLPSPSVDEISSNFQGKVMLMVAQVHWHS
jgi:hypothetical protein